MNPFQYGGGGVFGGGGGGGGGILGKCWPKKRGLPMDREEQTLAHSVFFFFPPPGSLPTPRGPTVKNLAVLYQKKFYFQFGAA